MSAVAPVGHQDLPRTSEVSHPATTLLRGGRPFARWILRRRYRLEVSGAERVPASGPVVIVANHIGFIDGPLMAIQGPRPVHALTKIEMFDGVMGSFLAAAGQIPVDRGAPDTGAIRTCLKVLRDGGVIGIFPEGARGAGEVAVAEPGAAYLAIATGAPVIPLAFLGTRVPGGALSSIPPRGARVRMMFGEPVRLPAHGWPRRRAEVRNATDQIRNALLDTLRCAEVASGMSLPGPAPEGEAHA